MSMELNEKKINEENILEEIEDIVQKNKDDSQEEQEVREIERKIRNTSNRFIAKIEDEDTLKKLKTIKAFAKDRIKGKESVINSYILKRAIDLLYVSKEIKDIIGEDRFEKLINKKPFDIELWND